MQQYTMDFNLQYSLKKLPENSGKSLPATANIKNPVDVIGDARADRYNIAMNGAFRDDGVDAVLRSDTTVNDRH